MQGLQLAVAQRLVWRRLGLRRRRWPRERSVGRCGGRGPWARFAKISVHCLLVERKGVEDRSTLNGPPPRGNGGLHRPTHRLGPLITVNLNLNTEVGLHLDQQRRIRPPRPRSVPQTRNWSRRLVRLNVTGSRSSGVTTCLWSRGYFQQSIPRPRCIVHSPRSLKVASTLRSRARKPRQG